MKTSKKCIHTEQRMGIILSKSRYSSAEVLGIWKCVFMYLTMCISRYICVYVYEKLHICLAVRQNAGSEFPLTSSTTLVNENNMFQLCVCLIYFKIDPSWNFDIYIIGITDYIPSLISGAKLGTVGTWKSIIYRVGPKLLLLREYNVRLIQFSFLMENRAGSEWKLYKTKKEDELKVDESVYYYQSGWKIAKLLRKGCWCWYLRS